MRGNNGDGTEQAEASGGVFEMGAQDPNDNDNLEDDDDSSEAMEEYLQSRIRNPLKEWYEKDEAEFDAISCVEINDSGSNLQEEDDDVDSPDFTPNDRLLLENVTKLLEGDNSSSSEATAKQQSEHTHPETPPSPSRSGSLQSTHSACSSGFGVTLLQNQTANTYDEPPPPPLSPWRSRSMYATESPHFSAYNPVTCHSPHRKTPVRREIMGMSVFAYLQCEQQEHQIYEANSFDHPLETVHSEDDSEAALEMAAQHIRSELLQSEMLELAAEAEKAAEAGKDRFAAKPCVFQDDMDIHKRLRMRNLQSKPFMRRCVSEGSYAMVESASSRSSPRRRGSTTRITDQSSFSAAASRHQYNKLSVVELRDVNEVFPPFRQFHTHLRTHFFRSKVSQDQLLFQEAGALDDATQGQHLMSTPRDADNAVCKNTDAPAISFLPLCTTETTATPLPVIRKSHPKKNPIDQMQADFLRTFSLDQWTAPHRSWASTAASIDYDGDDDSFIGDLLSEHIASGPQPIPRKIEVPPGLDATSAHGTAVRSRPKVGNRNRVRLGGDVPWQSTEQFSSLYDFPKLQHVKSLPSSLDFCVVEPRALFDATDYDSSEEIDASSVDAIELLAAEPTMPLGTDRARSSGVELEDYEPSHNSILDEKFLLPTPECDRSRNARRNSIIAPDDGASIKLIPSSITDFVTPARLRVIRGIRRASDEALAEAEVAGLLLPTYSMSEGPPMLPDMRRSRRSDPKHTSIQMPLLETVIDVSDSFTITENKDNAAINLPAYAPQDDKQEIQRRDGMGDAFVEFAELQFEDGAIKPILSKDQSIDSCPTTPDSVLKSESLGAPEPISLVSAVGWQRLRSSSPLSMPTDGHIPPQKTAISDYLSLARTGSLRTVVAASPKPVVSNEIMKRLQEKLGQVHLHTPPRPDLLQEIQANADFPRTLDNPPWWNVVRSLPQSSVSKLDIDFTEGSLLESPGKPQGKTQRMVKVSIYSVPDPNQDLSERRVLQHSQVLSVDKDDSNSRRQEDLILDTPQHQDCSCLSLSPAASGNSDDSDKDDRAAQHSSKTLRRSTSTGALHDPRSWNAFIESYGSTKPDCRHNPGQSIRAAMNMISKLSPRNYRDQQRALYTRMKENDDFMNNFLYCSKPSEERERQFGNAFPSQPYFDGAMHCGEGDAGFCCTSFLSDALTMGFMFPAPRPARSLVTLSSNGVAASKRDPHSWLDLANERFDGVVGNWVGNSGRNETNHLNVSFQAPSLKKTEDPRAKLPDFDESAAGEKDETTSRNDNEDFQDKFDGIGLYDIDTSQNSRQSAERQRHSRHLSLIGEDSESSHHYVRQVHPGHSRHVLSDTQFELMYGISRERFAAKAEAAHSFL